MPGVFIIPAPPINRQYYPYSDSIHAVENDTLSDSEDKGHQGLLRRGTTRFADGLHRVTSAVSKGVQHSWRSPDDSRSTDDDADDADSQAQSDSDSSPSPLGAWASTKRRRKNSTAAHTGHDADDSFFLHGAQLPVADIQSALLRPPRVKSPVLADLKRSADYAKMMDMDSSTSSAPDSSIGSYISKLSQFVKDVKKLPWTAHRPTVDYHPGRGHRRFRFQRYSENDWDPMSWYALLHRQPIDLLSNESDGSRTPPPDSAIAQQPYLSYEYDYPSTISEGHVPAIYPYGYVPQQPVVQPPQDEPIPTGSIPIHGPPLPSDMMENQYSYPLPWPPPPPIPHDE